MVQDVFMVLESGPFCLLGGGVLFLVTRSCCIALAGLDITTWMKLLAILTQPEMFDKNPFFSHAID